MRNFMLTKHEKREMYCVVKEATLLSFEEYEKYSSLIPNVKLYDTWWLRSFEDELYADIGAYNGLSGIAYHKDFEYLRPALKIQVPNPKIFAPGEKIELFNRWFVVLDNEKELYVLCEDFLVKNKVQMNKFDNDDVSWEKSSLKKWLDTWLKIKNKEIQFEILSAGECDEEVGCDEEIFESVIQYRFGDIVSFAYTTLDATNMDLSDEDNQDLIFDDLLNRWNCPANIPWTEVPEHQIEVLNNGNPFYDIYTLKKCPLVIKEPCHNEVKNFDFFHFVTIDSYTGSNYCEKFYIGNSSDAMCFINWNGHPVYGVPVLENKK